MKVIKYMVMYTMGIYGVYIVFLAWKSPNIRSCTVYIGIPFWPTLHTRHTQHPAISNTLNSWLPKQQMPG